MDKALLVASNGDQLVVTKLDRLGRSLERLIALSKDLQTRGIDLVVSDQGIEPPLRWAGCSSRMARPLRRAGVLIYWHVERHSMAVYSHLSCSASEAAAMVEGVMRHGTDLNVDANYVDSHGQSGVGFGITRLLGFDLLPPSSSAWRPTGR